MEKHKRIEAFLPVEDTWFYGASDHLLEMELPKRLKGTEIEALFLELQAYLSKRFNLERLEEEDIIKMLDLCREIAILLDKRFGLQPDLGEF